MNENTMSPADFAAMTRDNGFFGGGDGGAYWLIILFLFCLGGGGNGFGFGSRDGYTLTNDFATLQRQADSNYQSLERKADSITNGLCDGFYTEAQLVNGVNANLASGFAQAELARANNQITSMQQINGLSQQLAECCCTNRYDSLQNTFGLQKSISDGFCQTNFAGQINTRDIIESQNANTKAILDSLNAQRLADKDEKIAEQRQRIFALELARSQYQQNQYLIGTLNPRPVPAYQPAGYGCGTGCGTGCGCGTPYMP